jgi:hypothetical protein
VKLRLLLAHAVEVQAGMLFGIGIGWTDIGPEPSQLAIAALLEVGWDETNRSHQLRLVIVDADNQPLLVPTPTGDQAFEIQTNFDVGRPPLAAPGRSFMLPIALNLGPVAFTPGRHYLLRGFVDGNMLDETPFMCRPTRPQPQLQQAR